MTNRNYTLWIKWLKCDIEYLSEGTKSMKKTILVNELKAQDLKKENVKNNELKDIY